MSRKRSNGDGSICKLDGQWVAIVSWRDGNGKRRRSQRNANSQAHARIVLDELKREVFTPKPVSNLTVAEHIDEWLKSVIEPNLSPATHYSYKIAAENHIKPVLGGGKLTALAPFHVQTWLSGMQTDKVGARTRQNAFVVLQAAMGHACSLLLIDRNPCDPIGKPRAEREPINPFTADEAKRILEEVEGVRLEAVFYLAILHGLRQGELFGLRWRDVDFRKAVIRIEQQVREVAGRTSIWFPKTKAGRRTIAIDGRAAEALRRRRAISLTEGHAGCELVFPNRDGQVMRRSNFGARHWRPLLEDLGIKHRGFHHCRHTAAMLMLTSGVPIHEVSRILGHARPSITLDLYSHWLDVTQTTGTSAASSAIFGGRVVAELGQSAANSDNSQSSTVSQFPSTTEAG